MEKTQRNRAEKAKSKRTNPRRCAVASGSRWLSVDWSLWDAEIARRLKVSRTAVLMYRRRHGIAKAHKPKVKPPLCWRVRASAVCSQLVEWDRLGVWEYIPKWARPSFDKLVDEAKELSSSNKVI